MARDLKKTETATDAQVSPVRETVHGGALTQKRRSPRCTMPGSHDGSGSTLAMNLALAGTPLVGPAWPTGGEVFMQAAGCRTPLACTFTLAGMGGDAEGPQLLPERPGRSAVGTGSGGCGSCAGCGGAAGSGEAAALLCRRFSSFNSRLGSTMIGKWGRRVCARGGEGRKRRKGDEMMAVEGMFGRETPPLPRLLRP